MSRILLRTGGAVALACFVMAALLPIYWMLLTAVRPNGLVMQWPPRLLPAADELTLSAVRELFATTPLPQWLMNSLVIAVATTVMTVLVATLAGYALSRSRRRTTRLAGYLILVAKMLPGTLLIVPLYVFFHDVGLLDGQRSLLAAILGDMSFAVPFATWMMKAFFDGIPREMEEAALVDGCGVLGGLLRVVLPVAVPAIAAVAVYVFIVSWNDFIFARTFLPGGETTTVAVASVQFLSEVEMAWNKVMAVATIAALPVLIFFFLLERYFVAGLARGHH